MATRYWVGGSGNWSDSTNHWATSSGGAPGVANTPTHLDNVVFDTLSNATAYTVTMDKEAFCADMTWGNPLVGAPTWAGSANLNIYGSLSAVSGMTRTYNGNFLFKATSTGKTITTNTVTFANSFTFSGVGGGWTLQDDVTTNAFTHTNGTLDTNGKTLTLSSSFSSNGTLTRTLTLGASVINSTAFTMTIDGMTFNCGTSSLRATGANTFAGGGLTYYEVQLNGTAMTLTGSNTFTTLTRTGTATKTDTFILGAGTNQTVSSTLTITGNSATNRLLTQSQTRGTAATLTAAVVTVDKVDFQDITGAGAASWDMSAAAGYTGDCGGNSMKALGSAAFTTAANQYFKAGTSQNWSTAGNWYLGTNGTGGAGRVPLPQDTAIFDANSITAGSVVITQDMPRIGGCNWTGATNTPTWTTSTACSVFGSITLISGMTLTASTQSYTFEGRGSYTITNATKSWAKLITFNSISGTHTIQDALTSTANITHTSGTLDTNNQTITFASFSSTGSVVRSLLLGSSTINCTLWNVASTGLSFTVGTSTIAITGTGAFTGGGLTYNIVQLNGTAHTVSGVNTFATLTRTGTATKTDTLTFTDNQTISGVLTLAGNSATNRLLVQSTTKGTQVTLTVNTTVTASNVDIQDMLGAGSASWNLSAITGNSGDCGGNSGITFTTPVTTDWQSGATWSTATWSSRVPLPQDTATFTTAGVATITQDMPRIGSVDFSTTSGNKTWTTSTTCSVFGSIDLTNLHTLTASTQGYTFQGRSAYTINSGSSTWAKALTITSPSTTCTLASNLTMGATNSLTVSAGTLDVSASNYVISSGSFSVTSTGIVTLGSATHTFTGTTGNIWSDTGGASSVNAGTSTIKFTGALTAGITFIGGSKTYNNFWNATTNAFALQISGSNTFNDFKIDAGRTITFTAYTIQTVTTFTAVGTVGNVITLQSSTAGSRAYIKDTAGTNTCDYLSLQDIGVTGGATWTAGANTTYVSGNIGWDTNPATNRYWVSGGNGYWDSTTNWALTSGGASGASVPIGENVFFDANSGAGEVMIASTPFVNNLDCTGFTGTFIGSSAFTAIYGNMTLVSGMTLLSTGTSTFRVNNTSKTLTSSGQTLLGSATFDIVSDTITLQDAFTCNGTLTHTTGTMNANNMDLTLNAFGSSNSNVRTITMGSGTWIINSASSGTPWSLTTSTNLTLTPNTSTIKLNGATTQTRTFAGGGLTYNNIWITDATANGTTNFTGSNTFNDFKVDTPPHTINFTAGTTTTVTTFTVTGTAGNLMTIGSITAATHTLTKAGGGTISSDYLSISYSTATPATTWYAGANSTNGGNNTGWAFTAPVSLNGSFFAFF